MSSTKPRLLFLMYHGAGHFNACFRVAKIFSANFDIVFAGVPSFNKLVSQQGFAYYPLGTVPFGSGLEMWLNKVQKRKSVYINTIRDRWNNKLYHLREADLKNMLATLRPDTILLDAQQSTDFIALYPHIKKCNTKIALLHTMLPTTISDAVPPLNSLALPGNVNAIPLENLKARWRKFRKTLAQFIQTGINDQSIIRKNFRQNGIPKHFQADQSSSFNYAISGLSEIILLPSTFDFTERSPTTHQHYVGSFVDHHRIEQSAPSFLESKERIFNLIKTQQAKLVYCAFGSVPQENEKLALALVSKLTEAIKGINVHLIMSLKLSEDVLNNIQGSDQVHIFNQLPQLELLNKADLFITHGGLNSIKEGLDAQVPMLVFPVEFKTDHPGNSARIVYHKIGLRGDIQKDSVNDIREKISTLLGDDSFKNNFRKFTPATNEKDEQKLISLIQSLRPIS